jgi:hypothetical protein
MPTWKNNVALNRGRCNARGRCRLLAGLAEYRLGCHDATGSGDEAGDGATEEVAEVSTGDARHGRRDNGLVAAEYAPVGDVDPRVGEHLLDVLGLDGIAAYLRPSTDLNPVTRSSSLPGRPTDRLYVDRVHIATARDYVRRLAEDAENESEPATPSLTDAGSGDIEAAWAEIVAGYDLTAERSDPTRPATGDEDAGPGPSNRSTGTRDPVRPTDPGRTPPESPATTWVRLPMSNPTPRSPDPEEPSLLEGLDTFGLRYGDAEDEGYTPPAAPPVPRPSMPVVLAIIGIVGGLIVFLQPTLLPIVSEPVSMLAGFAAVVGGFATLVWRLRPGDDDDDIDPDDGARV